MMQGARYSPVIGFVLLIVLVFLLYVVSSPHLLSGIADSDELITAGFVGALPHPPGYPFMVLLLTFWQNVFKHTFPYLVANGFNALLQSIGIGFLYLGTIRMLQVSFPKTPYSVRLISAWVGSFAMAGIYGLWMYGAVLEVFALNHLFFGLLWWFTVKVVIEKAVSQREIFLCSVCVSLMLWHHQLTLLTFPFWLWVWNKHSSKERTRLLLTLLLCLVFGGVLHYAVTHQLYGNNQIISWQFNPGFKGWWSFVSRQDYQGIQMETGKVVAAFFGMIRFDTSLYSLKHFVFTTIPDHYGWLFLFILYGCWQVFANKKLNHWRWFGALWITLSVFVAGYLAIPDVRSTDYVITLALTERMYLLGFFASGVFISIALASFWKHIPPTIFGLIVLCTLLYPWWNNRELFQLSKPSLAYSWLSTSITSLPHQSVLLCFSDISCFGLRALQQIEGKRLDVSVIPQTPQLADSMLDNNPQLMTMPYRDNPFMVLDIMGAALNKDSKIAVVEMSDYYANLSGINHGVLIPIQPSFVPVLGCDVHDEEVHRPAIPFNAKFDRRSLFNTVIMHEIQKVEQLVNKTPNQCIEIKDLEQELSMCVKTQDTACQIQVSWWLLIRDSKNVTYRLGFADSLRLGGHLELAKREYRYALLLDPQNIYAKEQVDELTSVEDLP